MTNTINIKQVSASNYHIIILSEDNRLYTCGSNKNLCLGLNNIDTDTDIYLFTEIDLSHIEALSHHNIKIVKIFTYASFSIFITSDGKVYGCGNYYAINSNKFKQIDLSEYSNPFIIDVFCRLN